MTMKKKLKILIVNDYKFGGGAEKIFNQTYDLFSEQAIVKQFYGAEKHIALSTKPITIKNILNSQALKRIYSNESYTRFLLTLVEFEPDIVHLHNYYNVLSPSILKALRKYRSGRKSIAVIYTAHDYHLVCPYAALTCYSWINNKPRFFPTAPTLFQILFCKWDERGLIYSLAKQIQWFIAYKYYDLASEIDHIVAPSQFLYNIMISKIQKAKMTMVRNPLDLNKGFSKGEERKNKEKEFRMIYFGRLSPEKGLIELISALQDIKDFKFTLTIYGEGHSMRGIKQVISKCKLQASVRTVGLLNHNELMSKLSEYDAMVLPSLWYENAPLSLVEGAAMNLRLITANYGGMKEIAEICGGEYLINPSDKEDIINKIRLCKDDVLCSRKIINRDFNNITNIFSKEGYIEKISHIYHSTSVRT